MEHAISLANSRVESANPGRFVMDTTFVLFFLAMDIGASFDGLGFGLILSATTAAMFIAGPYLLPFAGEKPEFRGWLLGRMFIAVIGVIGGLAVQAAAGKVLPEAVKYLPMTLLIVAGILCAYSQIYAIMRIRLAR
jgi:hypothetical protein